ncbi:MAG: hypothetical protein KGI08_11625, partial [Thaumarchaeota archaeon]|nr:hypothetical protein [Nitrososphaerota archaeon]
MMKLKITNDAKLGIIISVVALSFVTYIYMTHADFTSSFKSLFGFDFATFQCQSTGHTNCLSNPNSQTCMSGYQNSGGVCVLIYNGACRTAGSTCTGSGSAQSSIVVAPKGTNAVCTTAQVAAGYIIVNGVCTQNYCPYGTTWDGKLCTSNTQPQYANNPTFTTPQFLSPSTPLTQQCPDGSIIPVTSTCPVVQN